LEGPQHEPFAQASPLPQAGPPSQVQVPLLVSQVSVLPVHAAHAEPLFPHRSIV